MPPAERVNPGGWRTAAAGQRGASPGLRAPLFLGETPRHFGGLLGSTRVAGSAGSKSIQPGRRRGQQTPLLVGQTIPILPPGPGIRSVPAAAQQLPTHATHTLAHTHARRHAHPSSHTNPLGQRSPRSPQQTARLQRGRRSGQAGEQAIPLPAARFLQEKPPRRSKNKVNFKVMQIVMQRFPPPTPPPPPSLKKKLLPTTGEKNRKKSANQAQRAVSVAQGSGWTGQEREEECPEQGRGKQMMVCRLLLELALLVGCRESWQLQYQPARCLEMDHLGEGERARDKCYQPEREKRRERASESASL